MAVITQICSGWSIPHCDAQRISYEMTGIVKINAYILRVRLVGGPTSLSCIADCILGSIGAYTGNQVAIKLFYRIYRALYAAPY